MCPYYNGDYKQCNLYGTHQENEGQRQSNCMSSDNWKRCPNYENSSFDLKLAKKLRTDPYH